MENIDNKNKNGFGWGSLLLAILFFIAGWFVLQTPITTLITFGMVFGVIAIVQGIQAFAQYMELKKVQSNNPWYLIVIGILDVLIGFYLVINPSISVTFLPILFAVWFLWGSISNITGAFRLKGIHNGWFWARLVLGIIGALLAIALLTNLLAAIISATYLIAFYFFVTAFIKLIDAFI